MEDAWKDAIFFQGSNPWDEGWIVDKGKWSLLITYQVNTADYL